MNTCRHFLRVSFSQNVEPPVYANLKNVTSQNKTEVVVDMDKTPTAKEPLTPNGTAIQVSGNKILLY